MTAFEYLEAGFKLNRKIEQNRRRIDILSSKAEYQGVSTGETVQGTPDPHKHERYIIEVLSLKELVEKQGKLLDELNSQYRIIFHATGNDTYESILCDRFIRYLDWDSIADVIGRCKRQTLRLKQEALNMVRIPEEFVKKFERMSPDVT